ncbi:MAG: hypothetical protein KDK37_12285 [Leptospiraceae bacterium]|nr:hypothetical protein [Leptospiraceae bacterium]
MARRVRQGGFTVFNPTIRPNVFSPVGVEDLIDRRGESALWFRMQPCPCPVASRTSDCLVCFNSHVRSFQESVLIENERVQADGHSLFPRFAPVRKVNRTEWLGPGEGRPLTVDKIDPTRVLVKEMLEEWSAVFIDYEVDLIEAQTFDKIRVHNDIFVQIPTDAIIIGIEGVWESGDEDVDGRPLDYTGFGFHRITLKERFTGLVNVRLRLFRPIKIAYRTMDVGHKRTERAALPFESGEIEIIVPNSYLMGEGDIITFLTTTVRHSMYIEAKPGQVDRIAYSPVVELINCYSKARDDKGNDRILQHTIGQDLILESSDRVRWLTDKPRGGYTLMYSYNPSFRIQEETTVAGGMDKRLPRQYRAKAASSYNIR